MTEVSLAVDDVRSLVGGAVPNSAHDIDWEEAISRAIANRPLVDAISEYQDHRRLAHETEREIRSLAKLRGWSRSKARELLGFEFAKANDLEIEEGEGHIDWLLEEAERIERLDERPRDSAA